MEITPEPTTYSILFLGFVLGLRHATEADHLAAVSTIVSEKKGLMSASIVGGLWGVGHTIALFAVGLVVILLKLQISESLEAKLESVVGVMLVILGINAIRKILTSKKIHAHTHEHGGHRTLTFIRTLMKRPRSRTTGSVRGPSLSGWSTALPAAVH